MFHSQYTPNLIRRQPSSFVAPGQSGGRASCRAETLERWLSRPARAVWRRLVISAGIVAMACVLAGCQPGPDPAQSDQAETVASGVEDLSPPTLSSLSSPSPLGERELAEGWIRLFDEQTLFGWRPTSEANWRVENGSIVVDSGEPGLLCTTTQFSDYVLKVEFRCDPETNSGIFFRTALDPGEVATDCYELNIAPVDNAFPTGGLVKRCQATTSEYREGWREFEVTVCDDEVRVVLDGEQVVEYQDTAATPQTGHIGLQLNQGLAQFRNIRLKPLKMHPLFNGVDLTGWSVPPDSATEFTVDEEGILNVRGGPGQLETTGRYRDFVLRLECRVQTAGINSGVFFRSIPGDTMMGYESQIHNGFVEGDRSIPVDCGTGGIFRRQEARYVVADDLEWFSKTLVVHGPHMAAWVNGIQVSDWTDERDPDVNPRRGLRLEAGTIIIQGHDPTTNLAFRRLLIAEVE